MLHLFNNILNVKFSALKQASAKRALPARHMRREKSNQLHIDPVNFFGVSYPVSIGPKVLCKYTTDIIYMDIKHPTPYFSTISKYNRVTEHWFALLSARIFRKFWPTMQIQTLHMAFSRSRENQSETFEKQIKTVFFA